MKKRTKFYQVKALLFVLFASCFLIGCSGKIQSQTGVTPVSMAIDSSRWSFSPTQVFPQNGRSQQVNGSNYSATLQNGKLDVYLPYYGRAYSGVEVLAGRSPLYFSSSNFTVDKIEKKSGRWNITIVPADYDKVESLYFTFFNNGTAKLDVALTNRSAISFNGIVNPVNK